MPALSRRDFPAEGHRLCDRDTDVRDVLTAAGFHDATSSTAGKPGQFLGRLPIAHPPS
jgi:hypothetical protein